MASKNNPVSRRLDYLGSLVFCYENTKTGFAEEQLEETLQDRQIPLFLQKKRGEVKTHKQKIHTKNPKQATKNPALENICNIFRYLPGSITAHANATVRGRTVTCSNCTQTQVLTHRVKALSLSVIILLLENYMMDALTRSYSKLNTCSTGFVSSCFAWTSQITCVQG